MTRTAILSSNIGAIGYDDDTQTLEVQFHVNRNGIAPIWQYSPVERSVYDAMLDPDQSAGMVLANVKRDPAVKQEKVGEEFAPGAAIIGSVAS